MGHLPMSAVTTASLSGAIFEYDKLLKHNDIRLLRLGESDQNTSSHVGPILGQLRHVSLDDYIGENAVDKYAAISYCWGDSTPVDRIWLNDTAYLPIGASAAYILRNVEKGQDIWIDAVCIDQNNDTEKSNQVAIMWNIFQNARNVAVWLGGPEDDANLAMQLIFDIVHNDIALSRQVASGLTGRQPIFLHKRYSPEEDPSHEHSWRPLAKLLDRPWFRRTWILQEMVAAKRIGVSCGGERLLWDDFVEVVEKLRLFGCEHLLAFRDPASTDSRAALPRGIASIMRIRQLQGAEECSRGRSSLQENLLMTLPYECKDPRDKIFSILSFSSEASEPELRPRYDHSVCDIYTKVTKLLLCQQQSLRLLHLAGIGWNRAHPKLPSWVPDYSHIRSDEKHTGQSSFVHANTLGGTLFAESGLSFWVRANIHVPKISAINSVPAAIRVRGVVVDNIKIVYQGIPLGRGIWSSITSEVLSDRLEVLSWYNNVCKTLEDAIGHTVPHFAKTGQRSISITDAFWSSLVIGIVPEQDTRASFELLSPTKRPHGRKCFDAFKALLLFSVASKAGKLNLGVLDATEIQLAKLYITQLEAVQDWSVFASSQGYLGRGPPLMRKNDRICIFFGARTPFIIRNAFTGFFTKLLPLHVYQLVGECYVEGLMRRELLNEPSWSTMGSEISLI